MARRRYNYQDYYNAVKMGLSTPSRIAKYGNNITKGADFLANNFNTPVTNALSSGMKTVGNTVENVGNQGQNALNTIKDTAVNKLSSALGGNKGPIDTSLLTQNGIMGNTANNGGTMALQTAMQNPSAISSLGQTSSLGANALADTGMGIGGATGTAEGLGALSTGLGEGMGALSTGVGTGAAEGLGAIGAATDAAITGGATGAATAGELGAIGTAADAAITGGGTAAATGGAMAGVGALGAVAAPLAIAGLIASMIMGKKKEEQQKRMAESQQAAEEGGVLNAQNQQRGQQMLAKAMANSKNKMANLMNRNNGYMTGAAAPVQDISAPSFEDTQKKANNYVKQLGVGKDLKQQAVAQPVQQQAPQPVVQDQQPLQTNANTQADNRGMVDKLLSGITDFMNGYNENANTSFSADNLKPREYLDMNTVKQAINPDDYNTQLSDADEQTFNKWFADSKANGIINQQDNGNDYDFRGYYQDQVLPYEQLASQGYSQDQINGVKQGLNGGDKKLAEFISQHNIQTPSSAEEIELAKNGQLNQAAYDGKTGHWTDKYKKPNHETFSNESMYATGDNAKMAGKWVDDGNGNQTFVAPRSNDRMSRLGEVVGTAQRVAGNPLVQGLLAYALTKGSAPGLGNYGALLNGYKVMNDRANTVGNQAVLRSMGYEVPNVGPFTRISDKSLATVPNYYQRMYRDSIYGQKVNNDNANKQTDLAIKKKDVDSKIQKRKDDTALGNANLNEKTRHNGATEKLGYANLGEKTKHNRATEKLGVDRLNETIKHNRTTENQGSQRINIAKQKANAKSREDQRKEDLATLTKMLNSDKYSAATKAIATQRYQAKYGKKY